MKIHAISKEINKDERKELNDDDKAEGVIVVDDTAKIDGLVDKAINETVENLKLKKWSLEDDDSKLKFEDSEDVEYTYDLDSGDLLEKAINLTRIKLKNI
ncbi:MAG: hypothetical protein L0I79_00335 [Atopostipes sp.]|nr:hypothetical protein [Atopostipes sp.]